MMEFPVVLLVLPQDGLCESGTYDVDWGVESAGALQIRYCDVKDVSVILDSSVTSQERSRTSDDIHIEIAVVIISPLFQ